MTLVSNPAETRSRIALLRDYFDCEVLGPDEVICSSLSDCRRSALLDRSGQRKVGVEFAAGQLPHVGSHYDLSEDGRPLRILTIAMETGRPAEQVTLEQCRAVVQYEHMSRPMTGRNRRNPHMQGVTHALRLALGRAPGADRAGEELELADGTVAHIFDACAMTNIRLCSAYATPLTGSRGTTVMSRNCLRHLAATVQILEPSLCIVQGVPIANGLKPLVSRRADLGPHLAWVTFAGVETLLATFAHPAAHGTLRWGGLNGVPHLHDTVVPTLAAARAELLGAAPPAARATPPPPDVRPAGVRRGFALPRRREECGSTPTPGSDTRTTQQVAADGRTSVAREVERRGGNAREIRVGQRTELRVVSPSGTYEVRVRSRRSGDWRTSTREAEATSSSDRFWVFVDLTRGPPSYFVAPEPWVVDDIRADIEDWFTRHGGRMPQIVAPAHHKIQTARVERPMTPDLDRVISNLAAERPVFHSEADFQHSLAWHLHLADPAARIRLETRPVRGMRLDILVESGGRRTAIELKYLVRRFHGHAEGELFDLPDQSAHDISRYDVVKDVVRTESFVANGIADSGRAIVLTNDSGYWRPGRRAVRFDEGRVLAGALQWGDRAGAGTTRGRETVLTLVWSHTCTWRDYSTVVDSVGHEHRWRYLDLLVPSGVDPVGAPPLPPALPAARPEPPALLETSVAREAVLAAARKVAASSPDGTFTPAEVLAECRRQRCGYADSTIRTHVTAVMCVDAPQHHSRIYADFERAATGRYRFHVPES